MSKNVEGLGTRLWSNFFTRFYQILLLELIAVSCMLYYRVCYYMPTRFVVASLIRCDEDTYQHNLLLEQSDSLHAVFDSLNFLGSFPWTINKRVN